MRNKPEITLSDKSRELAIASIRRYVEENLDEKIGDLKAALFLDYILTEHVPTIYNQAIADARAYLQDRLTDLEGVCYEKELTYWAADALARDPARAHTQKAAKRPR